MNTHLRRSVASIATVIATTLASLALTASPAAATSHTFVLTSGSATAIGVNSISETDFSTPKSGGTGCNSGTGTADDGTGSTFTFTGFSSVTRFRLSTSGNYYVANKTRVSGTAGTSTGTTVASATMALRTDVYLAANQSGVATDCATTGGRLCRLTATLHFGGTISSNPINVSTTGSLSAPSATIVVTPPCSVPFTTFNTGTLSLTWSLHFTT